MKTRNIRAAATPAILGIAALTSALIAGPAAARIQVDVNGQPIYFQGVQPTSIGGRVFLPLRNVAESLNAQLEWNPSTRTVVGSREGRSFTLPVGSRTAYVEGRAVSLDAPARITSGTTLVPLRFAAEALGAEVAWHAADQRVAINLPGAQVAGNRQSSRNVTVPADTVVRAELDQRISSKDMRVGDRISATLDENDRSRFPLGTRFEGRVTEVQRAEKDRPGLVDVRFERAILPDGNAVSINGNLAGLDKDSVRVTEGGRLESRKANRGRQGFDWKWVGVGAAGGAVLGGIFGDNDWLKGALLGALGGGIYGYIDQQNRGKKAQYSEVDLASGTEFGILLNRQVAFNDRNDYRYE